MYCSQCGIKSLADAKFCIECGSSLNLPETTPKSSEKVDVKGIEESVTEAPPDKIVATEERINQDKANTQEEWMRTLARDFDNQWERAAVDWSHLGTSGDNVWKKYNNSIRIYIASTF